MQNPAPLFDIRTAGYADLPLLWELAGAMGQAKDADYFERIFEFCEKGERAIFLLRADGQDAGYCIYNRKPKYGFFLKLGIPEIQDLNVLRPFRRRGLATALIAYCETLAQQEGFTQMGIGVGMDERFGAAQRLYVRLGYVPDGNGLTYDRRPVTRGEFRQVDDHLCLMMVKSLETA